MPNRDRTQSIESRPAPRRSESSVSQTQPAIKVVGFRVEGAAPSPSPASTLLADSQRNDGNVISGSPNPVIIPPSFQTDSPVSQAVNRRSGDAPPVTNPLARQRTAPVSVPGSLPDSSHLQDPSILVAPAPRASTNNPRDANSPAKPLMLSSAISLPPIGELTTMRSDIDSAVLASHGAAASSSAHPTGQLSMPPSPHPADTPTFSQRPTSPFAAQSGEEHKDSGESTSEQRPVPSTKSIPSSPHGTPKGAVRQSSFSHRNVPPIAATVSAAAAALGVGTPFQPGVGEPKHRSLEMARPTESGITSSSAANPSGAPKQDLEIPPPPLQPVHQSASAAELASKGREAEQQEEEQQQSSAPQQPQQPAATSQSQEPPAVSDGSHPQSSSKTEKPQPGVGAASTPKQHQGAKAEIQQGQAPPVREASRLQKESKPEGHTAKQESSQVKKETAQAPQDSQDKPKTTKAERRAKQEAERAAKAAGAPKGGGKQAAPKQSQAGAKQVPPAASSDKQAATSASAQSQAPAQGMPAGPKAKPAKQASRVQQQQKGATDTQAMSLPSDVFAHLPRYNRVTLDSVLAKYNHDFPFHPEVLKLGLRYADGTIKGANARCIAMLDMLRQMVEDYTTPAGKVLSRDLTQQLNNAIQFLVHCRPLSISMGNAIKYVKLQVSKIDPAAHEVDAKEELVEKINTYIQEKIVFADNVLVTNAVAKVYDDDVILTYSFSSVIFNILLRAKKEGKKFRVVVMDSRPQLEGRALLRRLLSQGIACTYVLLNAASYIMSEVTKVFLGASAVLSNGTVMSRAGSAAVAMMATASSKPVIICCETYKFHEKVQLDSITANELGDPSVLTQVARRPDVTALQDWESQPRLGLLNLVYDAMPQDYITLVVTEFGAIPPTSVPVILREYRQEPTI